VGNAGTICEDKELQLLLAQFPLEQAHKPLPRAQKKKVIVMAGPTGVGKTVLSLLIAKVIGGEIVSADSMQVYRGMDIGTAKVSIEQRQEVIHHLIDSRSLDETYNVVEFYREANLAIKEILDREAVPIVVGGTGFYIHSLIYGPPSGPPSEPELRAQIEIELDKLGTEVLYKRLKQLDPDYAMTVTPKDRQKIVRALEIISVTKNKVSALPSANSELAEAYDFRCWFLYMPKEVLYPRIEKRCDEMLAKGFTKEVEQLELQGLRKNKIASQAIGYRQCLSYLQSLKTPEDLQKFIMLFKQSSRRYAKRQFTWFRKEPLFRWLNLNKVSLEIAAEIIIRDYEQSF
jgi:tRNA dimethylallyltransferase